MTTNIPATDAAPSTTTTTADPANRLVEVGDGVRKATAELACAETDLRAALLAVRDQLRAGLPADPEVLRSAVERAQAANKELRATLRSAEVELNRVSVQAALAINTTTDANPAQLDPISVSHRELIEPVVGPLGDLDVRPVGGRTFRWTGTDEVGRVRSGTIRSEIGAGDGGESLVVGWAVEVDGGMTTT